MDKDKITEIVNAFCKMFRRFRGQIDTSGKVIVLSRGDGYWDLNTVDKKGLDRKAYALVIEFPEGLSPDPQDAAIELAAAISPRLHAYAKALKSNANRSREARVAAAKKAVNKRWRNN